MTFKLSLKCLVAFQTEIQIVILSQWDPKLLKIYFTAEFSLNSI